MPSRPHVNHPLGFLKGFLHLQWTLAHNSAAEGAAVTSCRSVYCFVSCTARPVAQTHPMSTCSFLLVCLVAMPMLTTVCTLVELASQKSVLPPLKCSCEEAVSPLYTCHVERVCPLRGSFRRATCFLLKH